MKGKTLLVFAVVAALAAGGIIWKETSCSQELPAARVAVHSESMENDSFSWCFDADDSQGNPLETVFYTEEWTPVHDGATVDVVVRLYESPAEGRTPLRRVARDNSNSTEFVLTCVRPGEVLRQYPDASYRIRFGGRNLGTWRMDPKSTLASVF